MFRCELTGLLTKPGEKMKKIVLETREKVYMDEKGLEIGRGTEIVKEISVSEEAYLEYLKDHPEMVVDAEKTKKPSIVNDESSDEFSSYSYDMFDS